MATCVIFVSVGSNFTSPAAALPHLGMACGFFAKTARLKYKPFDAVVTLLRVCQKMVGEGA